MKTQRIKHKASFWGLLKKVHRDQRGAVSIEMILILAAIALPILIFIIKVGWPRIKSFFERGLDDLEDSSQNAADDGF